jgi:hypothetical protein
MPHGTATSPDSLYYFNVAEHFHRGLGIVETNFDFSIDTAYRPMTTWPPLYPVVLSFFIDNKTPLEISVKILNTALLCTTAIIFSLLTARMIGLAGGILASIFLMLQPPILTIYTYAWSETLFVPLILLSYLFGWHFYLSSANQSASDTSKISIALCAVCLAAACYTRYIGIAFLPGIIFFAYMKNGSQRERIKFSAILLLFTTALLLPLFLRNLAITGSISGSQRAPSDQFLITNIANLSKIFWLHFATFSTTGYAILIIAASVSTLLFFQKKKTQRIAISDTSLKHRSEIWPPLAWLFSYTVTLVALSSWKTFDPIDSRFASVGTPFLLLLLIAITIKLHRISQSALILAPAGLWVLLQFNYGLTTFETALSSWRNNFSPNFVAHEGITYNNFTANPNYRIFKTVFEKLSATHPDPVIFFDGRPMIFHYLTGAQVKSLSAPTDSAAIDKMNQLEKGKGFLILSTEDSKTAYSSAYNKNWSSVEKLPGFENFGIEVVALPLPRVPKDQ